MFTIEGMILIAVGTSFRHYLFSGHDFSMAKNPMDSIEDLLQLIWKVDILWGKTTNW